MSQLGGGGAVVETIIVGGLAVDVVGELLASIQIEVATADVSEILVPVDASFITVTVEGEHDIGLEVC